MAKKHPTKSKYAAQDVVNCTSANLRKATRLVTQAYDAALRPSGLRATQFSLLATLDKIGDAPLTGLADALVMDRTTLSRNLKPLVADNLICFKNEADQRVRMTSLTQKGRKTLERALPAWREVQLILVERLGEEHWSRLLTDLRELTRKIRDK